MKRFVKFTAVGLSCALAFSLAACGGGDDGGNQNNAPDPNGIKTEQVTETEWKNAFDFSNVTNVTFKSTEKYPVLTGGIEETYDIAKFDGNKIYTESYNYDEDYDEEDGIPPKITVKSYYSIDGETAYAYDYDNSAKKWEKYNAEWYPTISGSIGNLTGLANKFSNFTYDSDKNAYIGYDVDGYREAYSVSVKITGGKVSVIQMDMSEEMAGSLPKYGSLIYQAYDFGTTSVTLPNASESVTPGIIITPIGSGMVTEDQWNDALGVAAFLNVTMKVTTERRGKESSIVYKYDGSTGCVLQEEKDNSRLHAYTDDGLYQFSLSDDGEWEFMSKITADDLYFDKDVERNIVSIVSVFKYSIFTYSDGVYSVTDYTDEDMDGYVADYVHVTFDSGRLVRFEYSVSYQGKNETTVMVFYDYDNTTVEMPKVDISTDEVEE